MVILAASICTRGGKAVLSRQFRDMPRSRIEALLASFPKLADSGTQHTIAEQDNVRFVYQPLDELYLVLITNRQSNILQDIDSLHIFVQVITNACKILDEREVVKNAYELLSAFDELVILGFRENLSINQIKTFLEMESHEERIQEIIARNKELEATEERKRKAKQLEIQRKESARSGRGIISKSKGFPMYQMSPSSPVIAPVETHETEDHRMPAARTGKGMQLSRKSKSSDIFEQVRGDFIDKADSSSNYTAFPVTQDIVEPLAPSTLETHGVHITISEVINARLTREGVLVNMTISGDLSLRVSDATLSKVKLHLKAIHSHDCQFRTHPNVNRTLFHNDEVIQLSNQTRGFPLNNTVGVLRWRANPKIEDITICPIAFTVWSGRNADKYSITIEYELTGGVDLKDVSLLIPCAGAEPVVSSFDAAYEVSGDAMKWKIGSIDPDYPIGSFEFEATSGNQDDFFPMIVNFNRTKPIINIDVVSINLVDMNHQQEISFTKDVRSYAEHFVIE